MRARLCVYVRVCDYVTISNDEDKGDTRFQARMIRIRVGDAQEKGGGAGECVRTQILQALNIM